MAQLLDIQRALAAVLLLAADPPRELVLGRAGEAAVPDVPYILYRLDKATPQDFPTVVIDGTTQTISSNAAPLEYVIEWVGGDAMGAAVRFLNLLHSTQRTADLYGLCGLMGYTPPQDLTALELGTMRARVQTRLTLNAALTSVIDPETIEHECIRVRETEHSFDKTYCIEQGVNP